MKKLLALASLAALAGAALAQDASARVAVPFYTPPAFLQGLHRFWYAPRAQEFDRAAQALAPALQAVCEGGDYALAPVRQRWQAAALAWDRLAAVPVGPLVQRRSLRQIDFTPTRPELIERAIRAEPADAAAMERIGTPAKGLPALEWLLWTRPVTAGTPACRYAVRVAHGVADEARALSAAFQELAARDWAGDPEGATGAMGEVLNQWVGGLERLRWAQLEKPLRAAREGRAPAFPRTASGSTRQSWSAQWEGLRSLASAGGNAAPPPGEGLVALETYLRGRGLNPLADRLAAATAAADREVQALAPEDRTRGLAAARSLSALKRLSEAEVAPALEVHIGFSDADGD